MRKRSHYRPRPIGRPIASTIRDEYVTPAYMGLQIMVESADRTAQQYGRDHIAGTLDVMLAATEGTKIDQAPIQAGLEAFLPVAQRFDAGGPLRADGAQLQAIRAAIVHIDDCIGRLRTHQIIKAVQTVNDALDASQAQKEAI